MRFSARIPGNTYAARCALSVVLLCVLLSGAVPYGELFAAHTCTMSCCAGLSPHADGSCAGGGCHSGLLDEPQEHEAEQVMEVAGEAACHTPTQDAGQESHQAAHHAAHSKTVSQPDSSQSIRAIVMRQPCETNCGAGGLGSINQLRERELAAIAFAGYARPPDEAVRLRPCYPPFSQTSASLRRFGPRGPPLFS